ncbi:MAG: 5'-methylthioadenosine/adenosylhomocysteine nucleosidase [Treponema sp.]|nr:5'-methylthioadenosine/adenosylhomocysteine nucleosidase [Treponema sp.]
MAEIFGIIGAMQTEVSSLVQQLENAEKIEACGLVFNKGQLCGKSVVIVKSGVGKVNAALCAQALILRFGVTKVINTGIAGAAGGNLTVFDFVVSTEALYHDLDVRIFGYKRGQVPGMDLTFKADETMADLAVKTFERSDFAKEHKIIKGRIASGDQFIADKAVKNDIVKDFSPMCVEMEGAAIAHSCTLNKTPFIIIRCMSDCADDSATGVYEFNEDVCAKMSADLVKNLIKEL